MSSKTKEIITYDPDLKLSFFKKLQIKSNIRKEKFEIFRRSNRTWIFWRGAIDDVFIYSLFGILIMLPFSSNPILMGLSIGATIWLYINRIHDKLKELLSSINFVSNIKYGK